MRNRVLVRPIAAGCVICVLFKAATGRGTQVDPEPLV
jgi:hypothetical protein